MSSRPADHATIRRALLVAVIAASVIGLRQLVHHLLGTMLPTLSVAATLLVETVVLTAAYGVLAWRFVVVPAGRRPAPPVHRREQPLVPSLVRVDATAASNATRSARARHLSLVPDQHHR